MVDLVEQLKEEKEIVLLVIGVSYTNPTGGTQISGGLSVNNESNDYIGHFGKANIKAGANSTGAGGGYYGGASNNLIGYAMFSGAGGSSFISGNVLCDAINESSSENSITHKGNYLHYSGKYFIFSKMLGGNENIPNSNGEGVILGNTGNGCVKITKVYFE